jgi:regulator of cell morphogenesis and NO signaling
MFAVEEDVDQLPVSQLVTSNPARARVLERFGIDYCCHGRQSLDEACKAKSLDIADVRRTLTECESQLASESEPDWTNVPLADLAKHIVDRHHVYLRRELPRLKELLDKVIAAHGAGHPELDELKRVLSGLEAELTLHMMKEEHVLFPIVAQLETALATGGAIPSFHCGSVNNPIGVMEDEHEHAGRALATMRSLTGGYAPPSGACPTYIALLAGLAELEADLHLHIHKENNIMFPRAAKLEARLQGKCAVST